MVSSEKGKSNATFAETTASVLFESGDAIIYSSGRRGVRIFGVPPNQVVMAAVALVLLGIPFAFIVAMMPFWDRVGDFTLLRQLNSYVAPALDSLAYEYRPQDMPRLPLKRFLIASTSMVELIFLSNFIALFARGVRKHALLVWICYDRTKIFKYFGICCLVFFGLWYVLFFDWRFLAFLHSGSSQRGAGRFDLLVIVTMPIVTVLFGHMAAIVGLGMWRTATQKLRRLSHA